MSRRHHTLILAGALLCCSFSHANADTASDRKLVSQRFPNLTIDRFEPSPIPGLYQVTSNHQILYASATGHMLIGDLWSPEGMNLSAQSRDQSLVAQLEVLPSLAGITIGRGPITVIEVSDPDCPHCRVLDQFLDQQQDLRRTIHYLPHTSIHPQALNKVAHILRADNPVAAHHAVMAGKLDKTPPAQATTEERTQIEHAAQALMAQGVNATPLVILDGQVVRGADIPRLTSILKTLRSQQKTRTPKGATP